MAKKTLVIGASTDPSRYAFLAANKLVSHKHEIELLGIKEGVVAGKEISTEKEYFDYVADLKPRRVIFNPGTENPEFQNFLIEKGIEPIEACTLVMLSTGQY